MGISFDRRICNAPTHLPIFPFGRGDRTNCANPTMAARSHDLLRDHLPEPMPLRPCWRRWGGVRALGRCWRGEVCDQAAIAVPRWPRFPTPRRSVATCSPCMACQLPEQRLSTAGRRDFGARSMGGEGARSRRPLGVARPHRGAGQPACPGGPLRGARGGHYRKCVNA